MFVNRPGCCYLYISQEREYIKFYLYNLITTITWSTEPDLIYLVQEFKVNQEIKIIYTVILILQDRYFIYYIFVIIRR